MPAPVDPQTPPPRAFSQGVGLLFQIVGGTLFLCSMFVCCGSSLLSKETATHTDLTKIGWHAAGDAPDQPTYSAQKAITISLFAAVFFGLALAGIGLGLQAEHARASVFAPVVALLATGFWSVQTIFALTVGGLLMLLVIAGLLAVGFGVLLGFSIAAAAEVRRNPPPAGHELLPPGYKIPYSHYHPDPPEVRLAAELEQRRQRLAVQQKELEMLEEKLRKKLDEKKD
jgi:lysylphosphatidylglycerol synthetase-like protein (DUF2156 family)